MVYYVLIDGVQVGHCKACATKAGVGDAAHGNKAFAFACSMQQYELDTGMEYVAGATLKSVEIKARKFYQEALNKARARHRDSPI